MTRSNLFLAVIVAGGALLGAPAHLHAAPQAAPDAAKLDIALKTLPSPAGQDKFEVTLKDASGKPVTDVDVSLQLTMAAMPTMKSDVKMKLEEGKYTGTGQMSMAGAWNVTVTVKKDGKQIAEKKSTLTKQ
jgi:nitrogen fixation protein FixH